MSNYVLITPAKNEEQFIEKTIKSVISQTILPQKWVIVNDGSTDTTGEIIQQFSRISNFIEYVELTVKGSRDFSSKVSAFNTGYNKIRNISFEYIGNLDADITFEPNYYEKVIEKFKQNMKLGLAGGVRYDYCNGKFIPVMCAKNSVGGPFQLFRRDCFESIGGFLPLNLGGEDAVAETMARMKGWEVRSFRDLKVRHYRCTGTADGNLRSARYRDGKKEYLLGYHPLFELTRCLYRMKRNSYTTGCFFRMAGFLKGYLTFKSRPVPKEFIRFLRNEQLSRLKGYFLGNRESSNFTE